MLKPGPDPEARLYSADVFGYLVGYADLSNSRALALLGDLDASAYELLFSFSTPEEGPVPRIWSAHLKSWATTTEPVLYQSAAMHQ